MDHFSLWYFFYIRIVANGLFPSVDLNRLSELLNLRTHDWNISKDSRTSLRYRTHAEPQHMMLCERAEDSVQWDAATQPRDSPLCLGQTRPEVQGCWFPVSVLFTSHSSRFRWYSVPQDDIGIFQGFRLWLKLGHYWSVVGIVLTPSNKCILNAILFCFWLYLSLRDKTAHKCSQNHCSPHRPPRSASVFSVFKFGIDGVSLAVSRIPVKG